MKDDVEFYRSFDARVWAERFVEIARQDPAIALDSEVMQTWFANALMRGYDQHYWESKEYKRMVRRAKFPWWKRPFVRLSEV